VHPLPPAIVALALLAATAAPATARQQATARPRLEIVVLYPLTVVGTSFRPREAVRVTVFSHGSTTKRTTASRGGRFTVAFPVRIARCTSLLVRATGSQGSRVSYALPRPECIEP